MATSPEPTTTSAPGRKRPRGRPAQSQAEVARRRREIVEAAFEVFTEQGYHATGISDVAARVGTGHGTIYRYFENKRDLLDHVIDLGVERAMESLNIADLSHATSRAEFRVQMSRLGDGLFAQVIDRDPRVPRLLVLEAAAIDTEMLHRVFGMMESVIVTLSISLQDAVDRGFLRAGLDCPSAARALLGCATAALLAEARGTGMSREARRRYVDTVVSFLCDGVDPDA